MAPVYHRLTLITADSERRQVIYDSANSRLLNTDGSSAIEMKPVFEDDIDAICKDNPGRKAINPRRIKISLGTGCNFSCTYCNQRSSKGDVAGDIREFVEKMSTWRDGSGEGVRIELWGGEPFVYWKKLNPLGRLLRERYPLARISLITNGSLLDDEKIAWIIENDIVVGISHDGPGQGTRGQNPLADRTVVDAINSLLDARPTKVGFNCVLTAGNFSLKSIHKRIASYLGRSDFNLSTEGIVQVNDAQAFMTSPLTDDDHSGIRLGLLSEIISGSSACCSTIEMKIDDFEGSLRSGRRLETVGQKCSLDRHDEIVVDLNGNILTCQNFTSEDERIGHIDAIEDARLGATHFLHREKCRECPVVQLCQGGCMHLDGWAWDVSCQNNFTFNVAILSGAIYRMTGMAVIEIERVYLEDETADIGAF